MDNVNAIREQLSILYKNKIFVPDKSGKEVIEILGAQFLADEPTIFGKLNKPYIEKELDWYLSRSLNVNDMKPPIPKIWRDVASDEGFINSNYGYLVFSAENYSQFEYCRNELHKNLYSRRAVIIYTRPSMWIQYDKSGMSDFICTNTVQYFIRTNPIEPKIFRLFARVDMRSNDVWSGYRNDFAWQKFVFDQLYAKLVPTYSNLKKGAIIWCCGSLHLYEQNFDLVKHFIDTGEHSPEPEKLMVTRSRLIQEGAIRQ
jgi:thymidylate synthase